MRDGWIMRGWMILACCGLSALACADEGQLLLDQRALLLNDSRLPREAALDRLQQVRFAFRESQAEADQWPIWTRVQGYHGHWDGGLQRRGESLTLGLDRPFAGQWIGGGLVALS